MHLADTFIQSDLHTFFFSMCVPWELNSQPFALITQCSTTEPQEVCANEGMEEITSNLRHATQSVHKSSQQGMIVCIYQSRMDPMDWGPKHYSYLITDVCFGLFLKLCSSFCKSWLGWCCCNLFICFNWLTSAKLLRFESILYKSSYP